MDAYKELAGRMAKYLTINQACAALQVSRNTLLAMIRDGRVKAVDIKRPGGKYDVWRVVPEIQTPVEEQIKLKEIEKRMEL